MLIEYGSGSSTKTRILLDHMERPVGYVPIDISPEQLQQVVNLGKVSIRFDCGESIWTEGSYKYNLHEFAALAEAAGWRVEQVWTDDRDLFSVQYLKTA